MKIKDDSLVLAEAFIFNEKTFRSAIADNNEKPYDNLYNIARTYGALNKVSLADHFVNTVKRASHETYPKL